MRNTLFLATESDAFLEAAGLLLLWKRGFVEPITPPPHPQLQRRVNLKPLGALRGSGLEWLSAMLRPHQGQNENRSDTTQLQ